MSYDIWLSFVFVAFLFIVSPGPAVLMVISNSVNYNIKIVFYSLLGNTLGLFFLSLVSILGLGLILKSSVTLFIVVKVIGALYLIYLGVRHILNAKSVKLALETSLPSSIPFMQAFKGGFLLAATNPKPVLFFTSLFPQFMDINSAILLQFLILTSSFMIISIVVLFVYGILAHQVQSLICKGQRLSWFYRVVGGIYIVMGVALLGYKKSN